MYERPDRPTLLPTARETHDGRYLMLGTVGDGPPDAHAMIVKDLHHGNRTVAVINPPHDETYDFIDSAGKRSTFSPTIKRREGSWSRSI